MAVEKTYLREKKRIYFTVRTKLLAGLTQKIYDSTFSGGLGKAIVFQQLQENY